MQNNNNYPCVYSDVQILVENKKYSHIWSDSTLLIFAIATGYEINHTAPLQRPSSKTLKYSGMHLIKMIFLLGIWYTTSYLWYNDVLCTV